MVSASAAISPLASTISFLERSPSATAGHHLDDAAHLPRQVRGHQVHVVGEVLPGAGHAGHLRLPSQLALGADLARHARHLRGEDAQLLHHRVDGLLELQDLALGVDGDLLGEVAVGHRRGDQRDVAHLRGQIAGQHVHVVGEVAPRAGRAGHARLPAQLALDADLASHGGHLVGEHAQRVGHAVDGVGQRRHFAARLDHQLLRQIALGDGGHHLDDAAHLTGEVRGHQVHVVGEVLPGARHARHLRLSAQLPLGAHFTSDARHLARERPQLLDGGVDGVLELQDLTPGVDGDLL